MSCLAKVEIYRRDRCSFCMAAEHLLHRLGARFVAYDIWKDPARRDEMMLRNPEAQTVPQIFVNDRAIGGYTDMAQLHSHDRLLCLLEQPG